MTTNPALKLIEGRIPEEHREAYTSGPARLVFEHKNLDNRSIEYCMAKTLGAISLESDPGQKQILGDIYILLDDLLQIPEKQRLSVF